MAMQCDIYIEYYPKEMRERGRLSPMVHFGSADINSVIVAHSAIHCISFIVHESSGKT